MYQPARHIATTGPTGPDWSARLEACTQLTGRLVDDNFKGQGCAVASGCLGGGIDYGFNRVWLQAGSETRVRRVSRAFRPRPAGDCAVEQADVPSGAEKALGYTFKDRDLLVTSLTHSSIADSRAVSNERLEFLGDAILGMVVCEALYRQYESWMEGELTKAKSNLVSRRVCAEIADEIGLTDHLIIGNGIGSRGAIPMSLRAAVYESVIGAIYLDGGIEPARDFVLRTLKSLLEGCDSNRHRNFKSLLQQLVQQKLATAPHYEQLDEQGPDHSKCFEVSVVIRGEQFPSAWGTSKKEAEQKAAQLALDVLQQRYNGN